MIDHDHRVHPDVTAPTTRSTPPGLWPIVVLLLLRTALLAVASGTLHVWSSASGVDRTAAQLYLNVAIVAVDVITLVVVARVARRYGADLRALVGLDGRRRPARDVLLAIPITVGLAAAFLAATFVGNLVVYAGPPPAQTMITPPLWLAWWSITIMPLTVAVAEELAYRGVALQELRRRFGAVPAVLLTSVAFGVQHAALTSGDLSAVLARVITTFLVGILFAVLALRLPRLLPLILAHWVIDVVGLGLPALLAAGR